MENNFTDKNINTELSQFYQAFLKQGNTIQNLFALDKNRNLNFVIDDLNCHLDFSKNWVDQKSLKLLCKIADDCKLHDKIDALFKGDKVNYTEQCAALHTALRDPSNYFSTENTITHRNNLTPGEIYNLIRATQVKIKNLTQKVNNNELLGFSNKPINTIINIGIGGPNLGPKMAYNALKPYWNKRNSCHFVSNIDPTDIEFVLNQADPETTLFIIASKSFTTTETIVNATAARKWLLQHCNFIDLNKHFIAITNNHNQAIKFGIIPEQIFPMWDGIGGRYSLWSAIGLTIALGTSYDTYRDLLHGAHKLDQHFKTKAWTENMPVILALLGIGYINYSNCQSHAILPYCQNLEYFTDYIQQLDMESNGKSINNNDINISYKTGPIVWGAIGTNGQHAFHQLLHQGTHIIPCDFIVPIASNYNDEPDYALQQKTLIANAFAQAKTLMDGYNEPTIPKHKLLAGNKPSNTFLLPKLTPYYLGLLIALYEHKIFTQGIIWNINSFDQWGVERGKTIANDILPYLDYNIKDIGTNQKLDLSSINLIKQYKKMCEL